MIAILAENLIYCYFIFGWLAIGFVTSITVMDEGLHGKYNPLWKIVITMFGGLSFVVVIITLIISLLFENYIKEIKEYYKSKKEE